MHLAIMTLPTDQAWLKWFRTEAYKCRSRRWTLMQYVIAHLQAVGSLKGSHYYIRRLALYINFPNL
jgi:hypothetical protein